MWAIRLFLSVLVVLLVLGFALQNSSEQVLIVFLPNNMWQYEGVQLWLVIYISFGMGVLFWLFVSIFQVLQLKNEVRKARKFTLETQRELDSLRNLPIGEDDVGLGMREEA